MNFYKKKKKRKQMNKNNEKKIKEKSQTNFLRKICSIQIRNLTKKKDENELKKKIRGKEPKKFLMR